MPTNFKTILIVLAAALALSVLFNIIQLLR